MSEPQIQYDHPIAPPKAYIRPGSIGSLELELTYVTIPESRLDTPCDGKTRLTISIQEAEISALRAENLRLGEENLKLGAELVKTTKSLKSAVEFWMKAEDELEKVLKHAQDTLQKELCALHEGEQQQDGKEKKAEGESDLEALEDTLDAIEPLSGDGGALIGGDLG